MYIIIYGYIIDFDTRLFVVTGKQQIGQVVFILLNLETLLVVNKYFLVELIIISSYKCLVIIVFYTLRTKNFPLSYYTAVGITF